MLELLLIHGADPNLPQRNALMNAPLHNACLSGNIEIVEMLLKYGAAIDTLNSANKTPSMLAEEKGFSDIVEVLAKQKMPLVQRPKQLNSFFLTPKLRKEIVEEPPKKVLK
jgi:ankyrin repeat protein